MLLGVLSELSKLFEFVRLGYTPSMAWEAWTKYIRHQRNIVLHANRAFHTCCITKVYCSTDQVGVCIAQLFSSNASAAKLIDECAARKTMINHTANSFTVVVSECELTQPTSRAPKRIHCSER